MFSFEFFIGFIILGVVLRIFLSPTASGMIIILITVGWGFVFGPWAVATFIELIIGWGAIHVAAASKSKEDAISESKKRDNIKNLGQQPFYERMIDFMEANYLFADFLSEKFNDENVNVDDFGTDTEAKIDYSANAAIKSLVLSEFMDYADSQGGELVLSCDEFIDIFESKQLDLLSNIHNMGLDEKLEFIEDTHKKLY